MSRPEGEGGDIFGTMLANDKDVMLAVTTGTRLSFGDHNHGKTIQAQDVSWPNKPGCEHRRYRC